MWLPSFQRPGHGSDQRRAAADHRRGARSDVRGWSLAVLCAVAVGVVAPAWVCPLACVLCANESAGSPSSEPDPREVLVHRLQDSQTQKFAWGTIRWLINSEIDPKARITLGIVQIRAGQSNPMHTHPNCDELIHVLSGSCEHRLGKRTVLLKAGDTLRVPAGVRHMAKTRNEPLRAVIVYDSGQRQFLPTNGQDPE